MRGYCPKCKEYRSDNGKDAWSIVWKDGLAVCERCGSVIDLWVEDDEDISWSTCPHFKDKCYCL